MDCGRADGRDFVVDGMLWRTAGKSARYAVELIVMLFGDICHFKTASGNSQRRILCSLETAPVIVPELWTAVTEY